MSEEEFKICHEGTQQKVYMGLTVCRKNLYFGFSTRKGDLGSEYLTKYETKKLIDWLKQKHEVMEGGK